MRVEHAASGLTAFGAIDDLWIDEAGRHYVVDYKATAKADEVSLDADWQIAYKRQVEFYQWLLRGRGLEVSDCAFFVYANGIKDDGPFDDVLRFRTKIIAYDGNAGWVEPTLIEVAACLERGDPPEAAPDCVYCDYVEKVARFDFRHGTGRRRLRVTVRLSSIRGLRSASNLSRRNPPLTPLHRQCHPELHRRLGLECDWLLGVACERSVLARRLL